MPRRLIQNRLTTVGASDRPNPSQTLPKHSPWRPCFATKDTYMWFLSKSQRSTQSTAQLLSEQHHTYIYSKGQLRFKWPDITSQELDLNVLIVDDCRLIANSSRVVEPVGHWRCYPQLLAHKHIRVVSHLASAEQEVCLPIKLQPVKDINTHRSVFDMYL